MKVKHIQFKFESEDTSKCIDGSTIKFMFFDISNDTWTMKEDTDLAKKHRASYVFVALTNKADYTISGTHTFFDRLKDLHDITDIIITYEDDTQDLVCPMYIGEEENLCQSVFNDDEGNLAIKVDKLLSGIIV